MLCRRQAAGRHGARRRAGKSLSVDGSIDTKQVDGCTRALCELPRWPPAPVRPFDAARDATTDPFPDVDRRQLVSRPRLRIRPRRPRPALSDAGTVASQGGRDIVCRRQCQRSAASRTPGKVVGRRSAIVRWFDAVRSRAVRPASAGLSRHSLRTQRSSGAILRRN
ncbi:MAG: hypothetical protein MHPSP_000635 [Paramarteilia canceri]